MIRVHRIPFSTNVERVALACGVKGVEVEWIDHDPDDRSSILAISGQTLFPVAEFGRDVVADSVAILERLDRDFDGPPLYPDDRAERGLAELFVEWFNLVWKGPPNELDRDPPPASAEAAELGSRIGRWTDRFDAILAASDFLLGAAPGIADICAYPFLRYAVDEPDPADDQRFHAILGEQLRAGSHPHLDAWIARMASLTQA